jgi:tyrosyl-tRNA synthetase
VLRKLQQFVAAGHEVNLLVGSGTAKIGDPTGRDSTRPELTDKQIAKNFASWQAQASKIIDFSRVKVVYNGDWLGKLDYADMIKLLATTTVSQLLERDMFQERIKGNLPIFAHEIIYPLMQGYDSVALDVDLEIGGTDQTFNMMMGRHLQKVYNNREKWVLTTPLINGLDGRKMSKTYGNFVALTEPANEMYGKIMSARDEVLIDYFTLLTDRDEEEIAQMAKEIADGANPMLYKKMLAHDITTFYHDAKAADAAAAHFELTVQNKELPSDLPVVIVSESEIKLKELIKLCLPAESMSNIKRLVEQGGVEIYDFDTVLTVETVLSSASLDERVLRVGKRAFFKLKIKE